MDLYENPSPDLTQWIVRSGLLASPFVVVDVGCQGGEHRRWRWLGERLELHGFDPLEEAIGELRAARAAANRHYHHMAVGNEDGERELFVQDNAYATSFYQQGDNSRMSADPGTYTNRERRIVQVRRLDTLFAEGRLPAADFIKLDCEGFEPEVLKGAARYLAASEPVGVEAETSFNVSPVLTDSHFAAVYAPLLAQRLVLFDLAFGRAVRAGFKAATAGKVAAQTGQPGTFNILFARDLVTERDFPMSYATQPTAGPAADVVLKAAIVFELFGLPDCAYEVIAEFGGGVPGLDVEHALRLLSDSSLQQGSGEPQAAALLSHELDDVYHSTSWRITAPMRALRHGLSRLGRRLTPLR